MEEYASKNLGEGSTQGETRRLRYAQLYARIVRVSTARPPLTLGCSNLFYQILRLRLLADRMVRNHELGVSDTKVVVVAPEGEPSL